MAEPITPADIYANTDRSSWRGDVGIESTLQADLDRATRANPLRNAVSALIEAETFDAEFIRLEGLRSGPGGWSIEGLIPDRGSIRFASTRGFRPSWPGSGARDSQPIAVVDLSDGDPAVPNFSKAADS